METLLGIAKSFEKILGILSLGIQNRQLEIQEKEHLINYKKKVHIEAELKPNNHFVIIDGEIYGGNQYDIEISIHPLSERKIFFKSCKIVDDLENLIQGYENKIEIFLSNQDSNKSFKIEKVDSNIVHRIQNDELKIILIDTENQSYICHKINYAAIAKD